MRSDKISPVLDAVTDALGETMRAADGQFVAMSTQLEGALQEIAQGASSKALGALPAAIKHAAKAVKRLGGQVETYAQGNDSVLLDSVSAAAFRTARILTQMGRRGEGHAASAAVALFPKNQGAPSQAAKQSLSVGVRVAAFLREGLDATPLAYSLRQDLDGIARISRQAGARTKTGQRKDER